MIEESKYMLPVDYMKTVYTDDSLSIVEIDLLHLGVNRNASIFTRESVELSLSSIYNKPIICIYNKNLTDFKSHAHSNGEFEKIQCIGTIPNPDYSKPKIYTDEFGIDRLKVYAVIWKFYNENTLDILNYKDGKTKVSIEINIEDYEFNQNDELVVNKFNFLSVCLLGDDITEGMAGSKLDTLKFSYDKIQKENNEMLEKTSNILKNININNFEKEANMKDKNIKIENKKNENLDIKLDDNKKEIKKDFQIDSNVDNLGSVKIAEEANAKKKEMLNADLENELNQYKNENKDLIEKQKEYEEKIKNFEVELYDLKKYKSNKEKEERQNIIDQTLYEVNNLIDSEAKKNFIELSEKYDYENIKEWVNYVKAECFEIAKSKIDNEDKNKKQASVFDNDKNYEKNNKNGDMWAIIANM